MTDAADAAEDARLQALYRYDVLDTPAEETFDRITRLARTILQTPMAVVSLIDRDRQWLKSRYGLDVTETPRDVSFCTHAIREDAPMIIPDATQDPRFRDNPYVTGEAGIRFYLGVPLRTPDGYNIGTLCTLDRRPREPSPDQVTLLHDLARLVVDELELRLIANTDSLTAALTRRGFMREAERIAAMAQRYDHPLSVIMLDLDHFKSVNDRHGHAVGDRVLRTAADTCRSVIRSVDALGRLGGEEFAILLPETPLAGAAATAERVREAIAAASVRTDSGTLSITASLGVAALDARTPDVAALIRAADDAAYAAKRQGRNRVVVADPAQG